MTNPGLKGIMDGDSVESTEENEAKEDGSQTVRDGETDTCSKKAKNIKRNVCMVEGDQQRRASAARRSRKS